MSDTNRGLIELRGEDSLKFLQGQVSCDLHQLSDDNFIRGCHCTPKGRVIFLFSAGLKKFFFSRLFFSNLIIEESLPF